MDEAIRNSIERDEAIRNSIERHLQNIEACAKEMQRQIDDLTHQRNEYRIEIGRTEAQLLEARTEIDKLTRQLSDAEAHSDNWKQRHAREVERAEKAERQLAEATARAEDAERRYTIVNRKRNELVERTWAYEEEAGPIDKLLLMGIVHAIQTCDEQAGSDGSCQCVRYISSILRRYLHARQRAKKRAETAEARLLRECQRVDAVRGRAEEAERQRDKAKQELDDLHELLGIDDANHSSVDTLKMLLSDVEEQFQRAKTAERELTEAQTENERLRVALREMEYGLQNEWGVYCPVCGVGKGEPHTSHCSLHDALTATEGTGG